jgi:hypothetical protein
MRMHTNTHTYAHMHVHTYAHMHVHNYTCAYTHLHAHVHADVPSAQHNNASMCHAGVHGHAKQADIQANHQLDWGGMDWGKRWARLGGVGWGNGRAHMHARSCPRMPTHARLPARQPACARAPACMLVCAHMHVHVPDCMCACLPMYVRMCAHVRPHTRTPLARAQAHMPSRAHVHMPSRAHALAYRCCRPRTVQQDIANRPVPTAAHLHGQHSR